jgi:uncharacterized protein (TIGR00730 family)
MAVRSITVYCSSSRSVAKIYFDAAAELGRAIADQHWRLVYGGNDCGCMGAMAHAARAVQGKVIGVTPQVLVDQGIADQLCDELVVTENMRERKALLELHGDAFVALPGGLGTLEEVFEILVARTLGYHDKPIVLINVGGFYDPLLAMIDQGIGGGFIRRAVREHFTVCWSVGDAIEHLRRSFASQPKPPAAAEVKPL